MQAPINRQRAFKVDPTTSGQGTQRSPVQSLRHYIDDEYSFSWLVNHSEADARYRDGISALGSLDRMRSNDSQRCSSMGLEHDVLDGPEFFNNSSEHVLSQILAPGSAMGAPYMGR